MASIEQLTVRYEAIDCASNKWRINIEYALRMRYWEAGSWFTEVVEVYGGDLKQASSATLLKRLTCNPWKLDESTSLSDSTSYLMERLIPPQEVSIRDPLAVFVRARVLPMLPDHTGHNWVHAVPKPVTLP
ncbi:MAG: hypothetical protein AMJ53_05170 [Gammaproteobacteria bacterium SG8_11]|nr:MAG: hypothetical protein AMJ53_05170 [Gammaproteobacteria bacterium SG8_11]